ncbi:MAG: 4'-phosphopantetheinyl transferase superfamily protein [Anaerolineaceae bacterium]|nr:4'-phosphopantetheinyl transferase superfamily protein [Anaerolineaceae bacterium]
MLPRLPGPLRDDEVHLYFVELDSDPLALSSDLSLLSDDERSRAARFLSKQSAAQFITARAYLRRLLSRYLDRTPSALRFGYNPDGKPYSIDDPNVTYNLAHSHGYALFAFALQHPIGVDLEWIDPDLKFQPMAQIVFTMEEQSLLARTPEAERLEMFYKMWTRKEAVLKAFGSGFNTASNFEIPFNDPRETIHSVTVNNRPLQLRSFIPKPHIRSALAVCCANSITIQSNFPQTESV